MKKFILISIFSITLLNIKAQNIKVLEATQQSWAGGVCCSGGTNYSINLESTDTLNFIKVDTIWMGGEYYVEKAEPGFTLFKVIFNKKTKYQLSYGKSWNKYPHQEDDIPVLKPNEESPKYKGQAFVIYHYKKQREAIEIEGFAILQPIAYP